MGGVTNLIGYVSLAVVAGYLLKSTDYISWYAPRAPRSLLLLPLF